jgi:hypothetical protein
LVTNINPLTTDQCIAGTDLYDQIEGSDMPGSLYQLPIFYSMSMSDIATTCNI